MLSDSNEGWMKDVAMVALGGLVGALPGAIKVVSEYQEGAPAPALSDAASLLIAFVCVILGAVMAFGARRHAARVNRLKGKIRDRNASPA